MTDETKNELQEATEAMETASVITGATGAVDMAEGADTLEAAQEVGMASRDMLAAGASDGCQCGR
jgi:hypothetical protein